MKKIAAILLGGSVSIHSLAQEPRFLTKSEVETLANGKIWNLVRANDQSKIRWDIRNGGYLYGNNRTRNLSDSATWSVNDQGQLCIKWRGNSTSGCTAILKDGEKLKMFSSDDLKSSYGELTVE